MFVKKNSLKVIIKPNKLWRIQNKYCRKVKYMIKFIYILNESAINYLIHPKFPKTFDEIDRK